MMFCSFQIDMLMLTKTNLWTGVLLLGSGLLLGYVLFDDTPEDSGNSASVSTEHADHGGDEAATSDAVGAEVWTCSMHPAVREDQPGTCPICGMELVPASQTGGTSDYALVMTEAATRLAQVQTTEVVRATPTHEVTLPGRVAVDERRITTVTAHFPGRIRDLAVDFTGAPIRAGQTMATIYSPELIGAQRELLEAIKHEDRSPEMAESARRKLRLWELSEAEIQRIEAVGEVQAEVPIVSPVSGVVMERRIAREQHVQEGSILYEVADLDALWLVFEAYEEDLVWLAEGQSVSVQMQNGAAPEEATITYIDPVVDPQTRTARVRAEIANPDRRLKPEMLVRGTVQAEAERDALIVPASAVLWTGPRSLVYVQDRSADAPRFEAREVTLGPRTRAGYVIEEGLAEGEHVVTNGAFRVDSEFQLTDRRSMMNPEPGRGMGSAGHDHGGMEGNAMDREDMDYEAVEHEDEGHEAPRDIPEPATRYMDAVPDAFHAQLTEVVFAYLDVHDALVEADAATARAHAQKMRDALDEVDMTQLDEAPHDAWMEDRNALQSHLGHIDQADDIEALRGEFNTLSRILAYSIQRFGVDTVVYHQYCPTAFDEEGAYWISDAEAIRNPYLPETMPRCGEVVERIE